MIRISLLLLASIICSYAAPLKSYPATLPPQQPQWIDGDSFSVIIQDPQKGQQTITVRLYAVDCPETVASSKSDKQRLRAQARYFGITNAQKMIEFGKRATQRTQQLLQRPFIIHTSFASALGRSKKKRFFAYITLADKSDLGTTLIKEGLARAKGTFRKRPNGTSAKELKNKLADLELVAAMNRVGIWKYCSPSALVAMREAARREDEQLSEFIRGGSFALISRENPADINKAPKKILEAIKGIGDATSRKIIAARPYKSLQELVTKKVLTQKQLNKFQPFLTVSLPKKP